MTDQLGDNKCLLSETKPPNQTVVRGSKQSGELEHIAVVCFAGFAPARYRGPKAGSAVPLCWNTKMFDRVFTLDLPHVTYYKLPPDQEKQPLPPLQLEHAIGWMKQSLHVLLSKPFAHIFFVGFSLSSQFLLRLWTHILQQAAATKTIFRLPEKSCQVSCAAVACCIRQSFSKKELFSRFFTVHNMRHGPVEISGPTMLAAAGKGHGDWDQIVRCVRDWMSGIPVGSENQNVFLHHRSEYLPVQKHGNFYFVLAESDPSAIAEDVFFDHFVNIPKPILDLSQAKDHEHAKQIASQTTPPSRTDSTNYCLVPGTHFSIFHQHVPFVDESIRFILRTIHQQQQQQNQQQPAKL